MQKGNNQWLSDAQENVAEYLSRQIYKGEAHFKHMSEIRKNYCRTLAFDIMNGKTKIATPINHIAKNSDAYRQAKSEGRKEMLEEIEKKLHELMKDMRYATIAGSITAFGVWLSEQKKKEKEGKA
jgi:hypothetical protein